MAMASNALTSSLSTADFEKFRDFFYRKTGICFENNKRYFVDKRILERMHQTGHSTFSSYFRMMRFDASEREVQELINLMTINETYFFREDYQFRCLVGPVLDEVCRHRKPGNSVRIWSVPSSSGEEPYSIAIYLLEYWPQIEEVDVELYASDIDSMAIEHCRNGVYDRRSIQNLPQFIIQKYFIPLDHGQYQISSDLRQAVDFSVVNISNLVQTRRFRNFDVIFCRNMLIYFDDESRRKVAATFFDSLNPGGFVFLGHSESMSRISSLFKVRRFPEAIVYQKPLNS